MLICAAVAGCATPTSDGEGQAVQSAITPASSFVLTVSDQDGGVSVTTTNVSDTCASFDTCQFAFIGGSTLTIKVTPTRILADCLQFAGWDGACAGQGSTCTVVINSDISTSQNPWVSIPGCVPR